ncbi:AraC family transcriptional regulator [Natronospirillum operosum]|uniref:AraC family transcriptional regulator n=1 Tax=Natronospirillum operosum TaxID=2759953 RepID=A0A4Z0WJU7_9GAMM|nr:AraC family transcriptional regulator [Natronospirillum operosum]TGG95435.1 AraC family transcriptional regulator [Natronospirillum operosum]
MIKATRQLDDPAPLIERFCHQDQCATPIPGVTLLRSCTPTEPLPAVYEPMLCLVAQGSKRTLLGDTVFEYGAGDYLIASVDLPISGEILNASPESPYLAMTLALNIDTLTELLLALPTQPVSNHLSIGLSVSQPPPTLLDAITRLLRLLERPDDIPILAPLVEREILYLLLTGEHGGTLRQIAAGEGHLCRISKAIAWIREHYADSLQIETLAEIASMSTSAFHRHFKAVTAMSPLQFQKTIRLQEARRLLLARHADAASVGFTLGYQSPSHFSREYARMFGAPPRKDIAAIRRAEADRHNGITAPV